MVIMNNLLKVCEIYPSIQGEGPTAGEPAIFIRLSTCNLHCHWCLTGKTKIETLMGTKTIKEIKAGDQIYGWKNGEVVFTPVKRVFRKKVLYKELIKIVTNKSKLQCTTNHRVYIEEKNYKRADIIEKGDLLKHVKGTDEVAFVKNDYAKNTSVDVYNLETVTNNYFANDLLVHNCDIGSTWNWTGTNFKHKDNIKYDPETEIIEMSSLEVMEQVQKIADKYNIDRVVLTGGEPLAQQKNEQFIDLLCNLSLHKGLTIEIETNGTIVPTYDTDRYISRYNVSPKLAGSLISEKKRVKKTAYEFFINAYNFKLDDVTFKFVVDDDNDIKEVENLKNQFNIPIKMISLMPQCTTQEEATKASKWLMERCLETGYRFCPRLQIYVYGNERKR